MVTTKQISEGIQNYDPQPESQAVALIRLFVTTTDSALVNPESIQSVELDYQNDWVYIQFQDGSYLKLRVDDSDEQGWSAEE